MPCGPHVAHWGEFLRRLRPDPNHDTGAPVELRRLPGNDDGTRGAADVALGIANFAFRSIVFWYILDASAALYDHRHAIKRRVVTSVVAARDYLARLFHPGRYNTDDDQLDRAFPARRDDLDRDFPSHDGGPVWWLWTPF